MRLTLKAPEIQKLLKGFVCVYKSKDTSIIALKKLLTNKIVEEGNEYHDINVPTIQRPVVISHPISGAPVISGMRNQLDYTKHPLVCGYPFRSEDIQFEELNYIEPASSGVCILAINPDEDTIPSLRQKYWSSEFFLGGQFGKQSYKNLIRGKGIGSQPCDHVVSTKIMKQITRIKHQYKRASFEHHNIDMQSEEAFELARQGNPKPSIPDAPMIYQLALKSFKSPMFALNIQGVNLTDPFLREFVFQFGVALETIASPRILRCLRIGPFTSKYALLEKEISLPKIIENIILCNQVMDNMDANTDKVAVELEETIESNVGKCLVEIQSDEDIQDVKIKDDLRIPWGRFYKTI
uniref:TruB_N domain-containing protein n=1 Tax=Rhabditophanes sp. KR3021 TaxID=114890 RepID=A0AC35UBP8_9BILA